MAVASTSVWLQAVVRIAVPTMFRSPSLISSVIVWLPVSISSRTKTTMTTTTIATKQGLQPACNGADHERVSTTFRYNLTQMDYSGNTADLSSPYDRVVRRFALDTLVDLADVDLQLAR